MRARGAQRKSNGVQLPFPKPSHRWCVMGLDLRETLAPFSTSPFQSVKSIQVRAVEQQESRGRSTPTHRHHRHHH